MAKIDQVEDSQKILKEVAAASNLQRFLEQASLSSVQLRQKSYSFLFDLIKRELSSRLSIIEAYFTTSVEFEEFESCDDILTFLGETGQSLDDFIHSSDDDLEKGGMEDA